MSKTSNRVNEGFIKLGIKSTVALSFFAINLVASDKKKLILRDTSVDYSNESDVEIPAALEDIFTGDESLLDQTQSVSVPDELELHPGEGGALAVELGGDRALAARARLELEAAADRADAVVDLRGELGELPQRAVALGDPNEG